VREEAAAALAEMRTERNETTAALAIAHAKLAAHASLPPPPPPPLPLPLPATPPVATAHAAAQTHAAVPAADGGEPLAEVVSVLRAALEEAGDAVQQQHTDEGAEALRRLALRVQHVTRRLREEPAPQPPAVVIPVRDTGSKD
jgi:hypothetical protein